MDFNADECTDLRVLRAEYAYIKEQLEQYKSVNDERYSDWQNARDKAQRYDQEMKEKNEELSNLKAAFEESQKSVELISLRLREAAETIKAQGSVEDHTLKAMSDSGASPHIQAVGKERQLSDSYKKSCLIRHELIRACTVTSTSAHLFSTKASAFTFPDFQLSNSEPIVLPEARAYRLPSPETSFPAKRTSKAPRGNVLKAREGVTSSSEPRMATRGAMKRKAAEEIAEGRKSEQIEAKDDTGADAASEVTELEDGDKTDKSGFTFSDSTTEKGGFIRFLDCTEDWLEECLGNYFLPQKARIMHPCEVCKREGGFMLYILDSQSLATTLMTIVNRSHRGVLSCEAWRLACSGRPASREVPGTWH